MVSSISDTDGAALIASIYNISIKVLDDGTLYANISAIAEAGSGLAQRTHRSFGTAYSDFVHGYFTWNPSSNCTAGLNLGLRLPSEYEAINEAELDLNVREIQNLAEQKGERVPDKREARAMARLARSGRTVVLHALGWETFKVNQEKHFAIILEARNERCRATLYAQGKKRAVVQGAVRNHFEAMWDLVLEVGP